jgi:hypothetical protein
MPFLWQRIRGFPMKKIALFAAVAAGSLALAACGEKKDEAVAAAETASEAAVVATDAASDAAGAASDAAAAATDAKM